MWSIFKKLLIGGVLLGCLFQVVWAEEESSYRLLSQDQRDEMKTNVKDFMESLTPDQKSALQDKLNEEKVAAQNPYGLMMYDRNYILPYYYTGRPYYSIYNGTTPDDQTVMHSEFKAQFSIAVPVYHFNDHTSFKLSYTQLSYWQFYAHSQYFRETNYEPQMFFAFNFLKNWLLEVGINHESNGRGGELERSWNRAFTNLSFSGENWLVSIKPWVLIYKAGSSDLHNENIERYLGHGRILAAYKYHDNTFSIMSRNNITSLFRRGAVELTWSFPIQKYVKGYVQAFSGYGQSLIEYDHYTDSIGIGIALSDVI